MSSRSHHYQTKQSAELLAYLSSVQGQHVTVREIKAHFESRGIAIGTTTIYRHLERMVEQGIVAKYSVDSTTSACFAFIGQQQTAALPTYWHCKCEKCGRLIHLQCDEINKLEQHMLEHHGFTVSPARTVFYGTCGECQQKHS